MVKLEYFQKLVKKKAGKQVLKLVQNRELVVHQRIFFKPPNLINLSKIAIFIQKFKIVILKIQILKAVKMQRKQTKKQNNQLKVKLQLKQFNKRKIKHIQLINQLLKLNNLNLLKLNLLNLNHLKLPKLELLKLNLLKLKLLKQKLIKQKLLKRKFLKLKLLKLKLLKILKLKLLKLKLMKLLALKLILPFKIIKLKNMKLQNMDCKTLNIKRMENIYLSHIKQKYYKKNRKGIGGKAAYSFSKSNNSLRLWLAHLTDWKETRTRNSD